MEILAWQESFNTGIDEVDNQHKQLLDYLNELGQAKSLGNTKAAASILEDLSDYTVSHFAFEESLMDEAGYTYAKLHKHVHQTLIKKVVEFSNRLSEGEDIYDELYAFLRRWLINHIQRDDAAYVKSVTAHFNAPKIDETREDERTQPGWMYRLAKKFFK